MPTLRPLPATSTRVMPGAAGPGSSLTQAISPPVGDAPREVEATRDVDLGVARLEGVQGGSATRHGRG